MNPPYHVKQATNQCNNEPWHNDNGVVRDCEGNDLTDLLGGNDGEMKNRIVALMNALAGCPDPGAFINSVKLHIELDGCPVAEIHPNFGWLRKEKQRA
jgi:hypothetical protein